MFAGAAGRFPAIRGLLWFDKFESGPGGHSDWPVETSATASTAFAAGINSPASPPTASQPSDVTDPGALIDGPDGGGGALGRAGTPARPRRMRHSCAARPRRRRHRTRASCPRTDRKLPQRRPLQSARREREISDGVDKAAAAPTAMTETSVDGASAVRRVNSTTTAGTAGRSPGKGRRAPSSLPECRAGACRTARRRQPRRPLR